MSCQMDTFKGEAKKLRRGCDFESMRAEQIGSVVDQRLNHSSSVAV